MSQANNDSTGFGAPVDIDAALIEAKRQVRDLLTEANKVPSDNDATDAVKQVWDVIDWMADATGLANVIDGDTIVISGQRIRLNGIDTPERRQTCR